ncbi:MAG: diguanylate cyclase [PVC group bacterium]|nr:diguanylate cyclase [PVC group bacterium]
MKSKIIVIEDTQEDFESLKKTLPLEEYTLLHAPNGYKGIELIEEEMPDLVILDLVLPDVDGFEVCKRIRQDERFISLPILFYTSSGNLDNKLIGLAVGGSDFLIKGSDSREVNIRIRNLLRSKKMFDDVVKLSVVDALTHVYNRRYFQHRLADELERGRRYNREFCCIIMDIDNFKGINDTYGHPVGDLVLKRIGSLLRRNIRSADVLCRYGGDEFGLLLPETTSHGAFITAERIRTLLEKKDLGKPDNEIKTTLSLGISSLVEGGALGTDELVTQADVALYKAKQEGRNRTKIYGSHMEA